MITKDVLLPPRQDLLLSPTNPNIIPHCTRRYNSEQQQSQGSCHSERVQDLLLASWAPKTQTKYNSNIRKRYQIHICLLMIRQCHSYPTWSMRKKESTGQLQLHALSFQLFHQKLMGKHLGRMTALAG